MKRFSQYIDEVSEPKQYRRLEADGGGGGGPSFKDLTGVNLPSDDIVAAGISGAAGQKLNVAGLTKYTPPSLSTRVATKVKDTAYDIVNKPHPFNPLTSKDIGRETGTARYHAEKQFEKETGRKAPTFSDIGNKAVDQHQLMKDQTKVVDLESSLSKRGYGKTRFDAPDEIGSNVGAPIATKIPKPPPIEDVKKIANQQSLNAARQGSAEIAAKVLADTREKRKERLK